MTRMTGAFAIVGATLIAVFAGAVLAQDKPVEFRYTTGAPPNTPWVMQLDRFGKDVAEESKGKIKINVTTQVA